MKLIDNLLWTLGQLVLLALMIPIGYLILHGFLGLRLTGCKLFIRIIIYTVGGCFFSMFLLSTIGVVSLTVAIGSLVVVSMGSLLFIWRRERTRFNIIKLFESVKNDLFTFCLLVFSFVLVGNVGTSWKWAPAGDPWTHEFFTGLILFHDRIPLNFMPFNDIPVPFGPGLHSLSAILSRTLGTFPGESILLTGSFLGALLPLFVFAFAYYKTGSLPLSLLAFCATFSGYPNTNLQAWVFGTFFNGQFPSIGAILCGLLLFFLVSIPRETEPRFKKWISSAYAFLGLAVIHYGFVPPLLSSILILFVIQNRTKIFNRKFLVAVAVILVVGIPLMVMLDLGNSYLFKHRNSAYSLERADLLKSYSSVVILISTFLAVVYLTSKLDKTLPIILLSVNVPLLASSLLPADLYGSTFGIYYLSLRMVNLASILSWIFIAVTLSDLKLMDRITKTIRARFLRRITRSPRFLLSIFDRTVIDILGIVVIVAIFSGVFIPYVDGKFINVQGKPKLILSKAEYNILKYTAEHLSLNDTVLADPTRSSIHLLGFRPLNTLLNFPLLVGIPNQTRAAELSEVFQAPGRYIAVKNLLEKYNVTHVLVNDDVKWYIDYFNAKRTERGGFVEKSELKYKPYSRDTYLKIFDLNPYLRLVNRENYSALYEVEFDKKDKSPLAITKILPKDHSIFVSTNPTMMCPIACRLPF